MKFNVTSSKVSFYVAILFVTIVFFRIISMYFGNNSLNKSRYGIVNYISIFPQGWAFFTKSSKDPLIYIYKYSNGDIQPIVYRNFSTENYFGISRHNRIMLLESSHIFKEILQDSIESKLIKLIDISELEKNVQEINFNFNDIRIEKKLIPDFEGNYLFISQDLLPWSLIHKKKSTYNSNFKIYSVNVIQE